MPNKQQVVIGLYNPKSPSNVGAVLRAAGCYEATEVRYTGERFERARQYQTDTKNAADKIPLSGVVELAEGLPNVVRLVCIELVEGATPLPNYEHPLNALYLFGPEDGSLPQSLIDKAEDVVYVPTVGCMNLAASVNVVLYDRLAKSGLKYDHDLRVKANRDVNNRLTVTNARPGDVNE